MIEMVVIKHPEGGIILGVPSPIGLIPLMEFSCLDELERFAMGIVGYCQHFNPKVPNAFLKAFEKEDNNANRDRPK